MAETPLYQVDAFTDEAFRGNPAAVCLLEGPRDPAWMQSVAAEMNLSETAFVHPEPGGGFRLRWFSPAMEVPLCGHATLATSHVLWEAGRHHESVIAYHTKSGTLHARRAGDEIELDFPSRPVTEGTLPRGVAEALRIWPTRVFTSAAGPGRVTYLLELLSEADVRAVTPDFALLRQQGPIAVIVTARAEVSGADFVSRFFVPFAGIDEDPVTGAAHCSLAPYWTSVLGRSELTGYQASARGGWVGMRLAGDRVFLRGRAVTVVRGVLLA